MDAALRVLLLEDRPADAELILRELRRAGYEPEWTRVETEPDFLAQLDRHWHVILADYSLPQFDGLRALEQLKARGLNTPFILVSGAIGEERAVEAIKAGASDYVMKNALARLGPTVRREMREAATRAEYQRSLEALRASERRYALLAGAAHDLITVVNRDGLIEFANAFAAQHFGVAAETLVGRTISEIFPSEVSRRKLESVRNVFDSRQPLYVEAPSVFPTGEIWLGSWLVPIGDDADDEPTGVLIVSRDITERRQLAERHARLATAVEQTGESIVITDADANILYVNPAFEKSSGYTQQEIVGLNARVLKSGRHDAEFYRHMWSVLAGGQTWSGHFINKRKDGTLYEDDATISPVRDGAGRLVNYVGVQRDVTEQRALQVQFAQAQKMESVGRLAGGIAHDFNNILTVINGISEFVLGALAADSPLRQDITEIQRAGARAAGLTQQLLAFSRKQTMRRRVLSLTRVVTDLEPMIRRLISDDITLAVVTAEGGDRVDADPGQIEQVLVNLIVNAADAMPNGGALTIEVGCGDIDEAQARGRAIRPGPYVILTVSDSGTGMDEATRRRVFEPFFTTKEVGRGTGLGLSTVYGIVKQSDGDVEVSSHPGHGTTFKIYLPRVLETPEPDVPELSGPLPGGTETILVVEDVEGLRTLAKRVLESAGYAVLTAASGEEALAALERHGGPVPLIVTDVVMPGMSGPELASACKRTRPRTKVLYVSGYTDDVIVRRGVFEEGTAFLSKPFSRADLTRKVREVLDAPGPSLPGGGAAPA